MFMCKNNGVKVSDNFREVRITADTGDGEKKLVKDYELSRYACYLISG